MSRIFALCQVLRWLDTYLARNLCMMSSSSLSRTIWMKVRDFAKSAPVTTKIVIGRRPMWQTRFFSSNLRGSGILLNWLLRKEALKRVEKRKAEVQAAKGDGTRNSDSKAKGKPFPWTHPSPFNPIPAFLPPFSMLPPAKRPVFPAYSSLPSYPGVPSQFTASSTSPSLYPPVPGYNPSISDYNPFGVSVAGPAGGGFENSKKSFSGPCWTCQQPGHRSADCPMATSVATNAGKFSL
jgi:hypothetical protein